MTPVSGDGPVCMPNISTPERRRRLVFGLATLGVALGVVAALVGMGVDRRWRLAVFPLFWGACVGFFQWRDRT